MSDPSPLERAREAVAAGIRAMHQTDPQAASRWYVEESRVGSSCGRHVGVIVYANKFGERPVPIEVGRCPCGLGAAFGIPGDAKGSGLWRFLWDDQL